MWAKQHRIDHAIVGVAALIIWIASSGCGPSPPNGNANSNGNSNAATPSPTPSIAACKPGTDDALINKYMASATIDPTTGNPDLISRQRHFNFDSINCTVFLTGYLDDFKYFRALEKLAYNAPNVQRVDNHNLWLDAADAQKPFPNGVCAPGWLPCNDICIPEDQKCNTLIILNDRPASAKR